MTAALHEFQERFAAAAAALPSGVRWVLETLRETGHAAYLAGGSVRDVLLGRTSDDYDVATSARPEAVLRLFPKVVPTGLQHGTVTVVLDGPPPLHVEVTTFRGEGAYVDGRRPESVHFLDDVNEDLARRDFTINAMAWNPLTGEVRDPFGGLKDLGHRRVRAVGSAHERFTEDGLRPMRAVRFASVLAFEVDPGTFHAIPATLDTFRKVAMERVRDELVKLLVRSPRPSQGLGLLADAHLLREIAPELLEGQGFVQNRWHAYDVWTHTLHVVDASPPSLASRLSALLHDVGKPRSAQPVGPGEHSFHGHEHLGAEMAKEILERLKFPRKVIDQVVHQVREHNFHYTPDWTDGAVRRHLARVGVDALDDFFALRRADIRGRGRAVEEGLRNIDEMEARFRAEAAKANALTVKDLAVTGTDVMQVLGKGAGPLVGETLRRLLQHVLDRPEDNTREKLLELARAPAS